jgi:hypothetical protein
MASIHGPCRTALRQALEASGALGGLCLGHDLRTLKGFGINLPPGERGPGEGHGLPGPRKGECKVAVRIVEIGELALGPSQGR